MKKIISLMFLFFILCIPKLNAATELDGTQGKESETSETETIVVNGEEVELVNSDELDGTQGKEPETSETETIVVNGNEVELANLVLFILFILAIFILFYKIIKEFL